MKGSYALLLGAALISSAGCGGQGEGPLGQASPEPGSALQHEKILFVGTQVDGVTDLYAVQDNGLALVNLTESLDLMDGADIVPISQPYPAPVPSKDGQSVLMAIEADDGETLTRQLVEVQVKHRRATVLATLPNNALRAFYDLSGERIFLESRDRDGNNGHLYEVVDGELRSITPADSELAFEDYFPEGDAFLVRLGDDYGQWLGVLNLENGQIDLLSSLRETEILQAAVSPDGQTIALEGWMEGQGCSDLFVVDAHPNSEAQDQLQAPPLGLSALIWDDLYGDSNTGDHQPRYGSTSDDCLPVFSAAWSQDGSQRLAFLATTNPQSLRNDVYVLDLSQGGDNLFAISGDLGDFSVDPGVHSSPRWAPDSDALVFGFSTHQDTASPDLSLFLSQDGEMPPIELTPDYQGTPSRFHWNRKGDTLLFRVNSEMDESVNTASQAALLTLDGQPPQALVLSESLYISHPMWLTDNTLIY